MEIKRFILKTLPIFLLLFGMNSCKEETENNFSYFNIATERLIQDVNRSAKTLRIPVNTTLTEKEWTVEVLGEWLSAVKHTSTGESFIDVVVDENVEGKMRLAEIKVKSMISNQIVSLISKYDKNGVIR